MAIILNPKRVWFGRRINWRGVRVRRKVKPKKSWRRQRYMGIVRLNRLLHQSPNLLVQKQILKKQRQRRAQNVSPNQRSPTPPPLGSR